MTVDLATVKRLCQACRYWLPNGTTSVIVAVHKSDLPVLQEVLQRARHELEAAAAGNGEHECPER